MSLAHLIRHRRLVHHAGRRYVVRGPTWATVRAFIAHYAMELVALSKAEVGKPGSVSVQDAIDLCKLDRRAVAVLWTCVETDEHPDHWPLEILRDAVFDCCDLPAIVETMDIDAMAGSMSDDGEQAADAEDDGDFDSHALACCKIAQFFGTTPVEVTDWPYEAVIEAGKCIERLHPDYQPPTEYDRQLRKYIDRIQREQRAKA